MQESSNPQQNGPVTDVAGQPAKRRRMFLLASLLAVVAAVTIGVTALLVTIFEHRQEARTPFVRLVDVNEVSTDPVPWGANWPNQFDGYRRTVDTVETQHGGSSAMPESKLESHPWLRRLYAGYAFSIDYREARGHAYMLFDQEVTERVTKRPQTGACLHCHASVIPTYRRLGMEAMGQNPDEAKLATDFNWPAVMDGFRATGKLDYAAAHSELLKTPDGTPGKNPPLFPGGATQAATVNSSQRGRKRKKSGDGRAQHRRRSSGELHRLPRSKDNAGARHAARVRSRNSGTGGQ